MSGTISGRVLIVAGSDSGGGAGIQADIKAVSALGAYAMTAVTALTAQNTLGVHGVFPIPTEFIHQQIVALRDAGKAILLVSVELDEILSLSDRIAVMFDGQIMGERLPDQTDETELGLMMAGMSGKAA